METHSCTAARSKWTWSDFYYYYPHEPTPPHQIGHARGLRG